jgi:hypothetical protein
MSLINLDHLTKGDRSLVRGSQRLKSSRELGMGRDLRRFYRDLGKAIGAGFSERGIAGAQDAIDANSRDLNELLLENNIQTAGTLGDFQMRSLEKASARSLRKKIFEEEIVGQLDSFLVTEASRSVFLITDTDRNVSARIIAGGISEGASTDAIARSLSSQFAGVLGQVRSSRIARTEVGIVGSKAQNQGAENLDAQSKQWIQVADARAREIHTDVDGLAIGMNEKWFPGGEAMAHPHDLNASAANIINCRCDVLYSR